MSAQEAASTGEATGITFEEITSKPLSVQKRDGTTVQEFQAKKIFEAIKGAWLECERPLDELRIRGIVAKIAKILPSDIVSVEQIQNQVENYLMRVEGLEDVAKAYIVFRRERAKARKARKTVDPQALADYMIPAKYARYREDLGRREVFSEAVDRVEGMHTRRFPQLGEDIKWAFDFVRQKKVLPSMRTLQFGGPAVEQINCRGYNCSYTLIDRPRAFAEVLYLLLCGCGVGFSVQFEHVDKLPKMAAVINKNRVAHHTIADNIEGWAEAINALITAHIEGYYVEFNYSEIRAEGAPLKTSGGKAPGHLGLKLAIDAIRNILVDASGRRLRPIECYDILCHEADAVLSGGVRRSALISLFSIDDSEMMYAKTGNWYSKAPWRQNSNNSVALLRGAVTEKQFRRIFEMTKEWGEPGAVFVNDLDYGTNPCQPGWTTVLTPDGIRKFDDIDVGSVIWSGKLWTKVIKKVETGIKAVFGFKTHAGIFYGTKNHRIVCAGQKIEVGEAEAIDISLGGAEGCASPDPKVVMAGLVFSCAHERKISDRHRFGNEVTVRGFLRGLYSANGSIVGDLITLKAASILVIEQAQEMLSSLGIPSCYTINIAHENESEKQSYNLNIADGRTAFRNLIGFIQINKQEKLNEICERIHPSGKKKLTYEITETTYLGEAPVYDITVADSAHTYWTGGLLVSNCGEIGLFPVLTVTANDLPKLLAAGISASVGDKITGFAFCNLTSINAAKLTSLEAFEQAAKAATIIGTVQAAYTDMPYLGIVTELITKRDALIGVSMTGMLDKPEIACNPEYQRIVANKIIAWNTHYANALGINPAARTTCVKPEGSGSLALGGVASGHHAHHARRYIRRVTANEHESVFKFFQKYNPHMCRKKEDGDWVIEFPIEAPAGALLKEDLTALSFLDMIKSTQQAWVVPGTARNDEPAINHNVSNTVQVKEHEWDSVENYLWTNQNDFTAVSLLPDIADKLFKFAPNEEIKTEADEARWNELIANYIRVPYEEMFEEDDHTNLKSEAACLGGACLL